jgi:hypothetical protein
MRLIFDLGCPSRPLREVGTPYQKLEFDQVNRPTYE